MDLIPDINPRSGAGFNQIVIAIDNFCRYIVIGALPDRRADTIARWFHSTVVCTYGVPGLVRTDGGSEFKGAFEEMCSML